MLPFRFRNPTRVLFGPGVVADAGIHVARSGRKALLVTGKGHVRRTGVFDRVVASLRKAGVEVVEFSGVDPNPRITTVREAGEVVRREGCDVVVGLGGGSVMDAAKVIAAYPFYEGDAWDMLDHGGPTHRPPHRALPVVTVPTLAGTGSEMNSGAVITNWETREKCFVSAECLYPATAVVDPCLTVTVPPDQTAYGAVDTLVHVLEPYFNGADDTPLQDRIQEGVVHTVLEETPRALDRPDDLSARANLQWASIVALNGWAQAGSDGGFPVHLVEHALSAHYDVAHGAGLSLLILGWMRLAWRHRLPKYVQFAQRIFGVRATGPEDEAAARQGILDLEAFFRSIRAPVRLGDLAIGPERFDRIADDVLRIGGKGGRLPGRPRLDRDGILRLLAVSLEG